MTTIVTLNCNGLRSAHKKGLWKWLKGQDIDVLCLQEIRIQHHQLFEADAFPKGWFCYYNPAERPGYAGTAILCRQKPDRVIFGAGFDRADSEGRWTEVVFGSTAVVSLYVPSGSGLGPKQDSKDIFMAELSTKLDAIKAQYARVVVCADWNLCHQEADIRNWKGNLKNSGFLPHERAWLSSLFESGWCDVFRELNQEEHSYTWWSNRGQAFAKNVGWRLDYQIVAGDDSTEVLRTQTFRDERLSDHAAHLVEYPWSL